MDKLDMRTENIVDGNIEKIAKLFPNCITEGYNEDGELVKMVDFDLLKQELSKEVVEGNDERYTLNWPGKKQAILTANAPINATLRPCREESVDFDNTKNLYIEGDNLEVLKLLRETYLNKIKMIYIDPPYNTGNDFVYNDDFATSADEYLETSKSYDEQGNRMFQNNDSNGRFHSDWLSMMYSRLRLAKDLLSDDGVIFMSIDDNEIENLRKICDEIYGESNFVAQFIWRGGRRNLAKYVSTSHEYILCFAKNLSYISENNISWNEEKKGLNEIYKKAEDLVKLCDKDYVLASHKLKEWYKTLPEDNESKQNAHYSFIDSKGVYFASDISRGGGGGPKWQIRNPETGNIVQTPSRGWSYSKLEDLERDIENGLVHFNGDGVPCKKRYLKDNETQVLETVFYKDRRGSSKRLRNLMGGDYFLYPKDEDVLMHYMSSFTDKESIVLDFFSGSATTAHAVMQMNAEDGGNRHFICVQLPEKCEENSEAYKSGFKNICEIGKERIRRAGLKLAEEIENSTRVFGSNIKKPLEPTNENKQALQMALDNINNENYDKLADKQLPDIGFRVLKLDSSCMKDVYYSPVQMNQSLLTTLEDNIKEDRSAEDLLFQVMLDMGVVLSSDIKTIEVAGRKVFNVNDGNLVCCFDKNLTDEVVTEIAKLQPLYAVFRDASMSTDSVAVNFDQIFETYSPTTTRRVI